MTRKLRAHAAPGRPAGARAHASCSAGPTPTSSPAASSRPPTASAWVFYEGPPTANGKPGTHHVEARVFKDLFPRFKTMKGYHVPRTAGWDCHGLPVELAIEKELGFTGKQDIEAYGVAEFNAKCRASVLEHVDEFTSLSHRMGYWVDFDKAYWTMNPEYIESVWWSLKTIFDKGLLVQDHRVAPYCPRCGTGLSDHEVAQGYLTVTDPSVYVRFPVTSGTLVDEFGSGKVSLLVWTTTPWTLDQQHRRRGQSRRSTTASYGPTASCWSSQNRLLGHGVRRHARTRCFVPSRAPSSSTRPTRGRSTSSTSPRASTPTTSGWPTT